MLQMHPNDTELSLVLSLSLWHYCGALPHEIMCASTQHSRVSALKRLSQESFHHRLDLSLIRLLTKADKSVTSLSFHLTQWFLTFFYLEKPQLLPRIASFNCKL